MKSDRGSPHRLLLSKNYFNLARWVKYGEKKVRLNGNRNTDQRPLATALWGAVAQYLLAWEFAEGEEAEENEHDWRSREWVDWPLPPELWGIRHMLKHPTIMASVPEDDAELPF